MAGSPPRHIVTDRSLATFEQGLRFVDAANLTARILEEACALDPQAAWLIVWLDYAVCVGLIQAGRLQVQETLDPQFLQELRLFGATGEWRLWRTGDDFSARRRLDGGGEPLDILDDDQSLWGTAAAALDTAWTDVSEARGIRYALPVAVTDADLPLRLQVRHYLAYDAAGMVGVADSRLVAIADQHGSPLTWRGKSDG